MAICIDIDKLYEYNQIIYYKIWTINFGGAEFYLAIDPKKNYFIFI